MERAQPRLPTLRVWLGAHPLTVEVARKPEEIRMGMMFRESLGDGEGMLFVFRYPQRVSFWMKNVTVPLSCAYLDPDGRVLEIHDLEPGNEEPVPSRSDRVQYVIEANRGWFERREVQEGTLVWTEHGALAEATNRR
jgi:uncharacterized protein